MFEGFSVPRRFLGLTTATYDGKVFLGQLEQVYVTVIDGMMHIQRAVQA